MGSKELVDSRLSAAEGPLLSVLCLQGSSMQTGVERTANGDEGREVWEEGGGHAHEQVIPPMRVRRTFALHSPDALHRIPLKLHNAPIKDRLRPHHLAEQLVDEPIRAAVVDLQPDGEEMPAQPGLAREVGEPGERGAGDERVGHGAGGGEKGVQEREGMEVGGGGGRGAGVFERCDDHGLGGWGVLVFLPVVPFRGVGGVVGGDGNVLSTSVALSSGTIAKSAYVTISLGCSPFAPSSFIRSKNSSSTSPLNIIVCTNHSTTGCS